MSNRFVSLKKQIICLLLSIYAAHATVLANMAESNFWAERKRVRGSLGAVVENVESLSSTPFSSLRRIGGAQPKNDLAFSSLNLALELPEPQSSFSFLDQHISAQLSRFGSVKAWQWPVTKPLRGLVVHVQDVHGHAEAQKNISHAISALSGIKKINFVGLEGSWVQLPIDRYRQFPAAESLDRAVQMMMTQRRLSGGAAAVIHNRDRVNSCAGIDDPIAHQRHVESYLKAIKKMGYVEEMLRVFESSLQEEKLRHLSGRLREFDQLSNHYRSGKMSLAAFIDSLMFFLSPASFHDGFSLTSLDQVQLYQQAFTLERNLNFDQVRKEQALFFSALMHNKDRQLGRLLLQKSSLLKNGHLSDYEYFNALLLLAKQGQFKLASTPSWQKYIQYRLLSSGLQFDRLVDQIQQAEERAYSTLIRSDQQRKLIIEGQTLLLAQKLVGFELTRQQWNDYKKLMPNLAQKQSEQTRDFERFYVEAEIRDARLSENFLKRVEHSWSAVLPERGQFEERGDGKLWNGLSQDVEMHSPQLDLSVLVAGGFHTAALEKNMLEHGYAVLTFSPKVSSVERDGHLEALNLFAQKKAPLEKLFGGKILFLASDPAPPSAQIDLVAAASVDAWVKDTTSEPRLHAWFARFLLAHSARLRGWTGFHKSMSEVFMAYRLQVGPKLANVQHIISWPMKNGLNNIKTVVMIPVVSPLFVDPVVMGAAVRSPWGPYMFTPGLVVAVGGFILFVAFRSYLKHQKALGRTVTKLESLQIFMALPLLVGLFLVAEGRHPFGGLHPPTKLAPPMLMPSQPLEQLNNSSNVNRIQTNSRLFQSWKQSSPPGLTLWFWGLMKMISGPGLTREQGARRAHHEEWLYSGIFWIPFLVVPIVNVMADIDVYWLWSLLANLGHFILINVLFGLQHDEVSTWNRDRTLLHSRKATLIDQLGTFALLGARFRSRFLLAAIGSSFVPLNPLSTTLLISWLMVSTITAFSRHWTHNHRSLGPVASIRQNPPSIQDPNLAALFFAIQSKYPRFPSIIKAGHWATPLTLSLGARQRLKLLGVPLRLDNNDKVSLVFEGSKARLIVTENIRAKDIPGYEDDHSSDIYTVFMHLNWGAEDPERRFDEAELYWEQHNKIKGTPISSFISHARRQVDGHAVHSMGFTFDVNDPTSLRLSEGIRTKPGDVVWDMMTGSGVSAIASALGGARVISSDISDAAVVVARFNAYAAGVLNRIEVFRSNLFDDVPLPFQNVQVDRITANPPMIEQRSNDVMVSDPNMEILDRLLLEAPKRLKPGGTLELSYYEMAQFFEHVYQHGWEPVVIEGTNQSRREKEHTGVNIDLSRITLQRQSLSSANNEKISAILRDWAVLSEFEKTRFQFTSAPFELVEKVREIVLRRQLERSFASALLTKISSDLLSLMGPVPLRAVVPDIRLNFDSAYARSLKGEPWTFVSDWETMRVYQPKPKRYPRRIGDDIGPGLMSVLDRVLLFQRWKHSPHGSSSWVFYRLYSIVVAPLWETVVFNWGALDVLPRLMEMSLSLIGFTGPPMIGVSFMLGLVVAIPIYTALHHIPVRSSVSPFYPKKIDSQSYFQTKFQIPIRLLMSLVFVAVYQLWGLGPAVVTHSLWNAIALALKVPLMTLGAAPQAQQSRLGSEQTELSTAGNAVLSIPPTALNVLDLDDLKGKIQIVKSLYEQGTLFGREEFETLKMNRDNVKNQYRQLGQLSGLRGPVVDVPFGGIDFTPFYFSPSITDVILQGKEPFGSQRHLLNFFSENRLPMPASFLSIEPYTRWKPLHGLSLHLLLEWFQGLGGSLVARLLFHIAKDISRISFFKLLEDGTLQFADSIDQTGLFPNAVVEFIDHEGQHKRIWFIQHDIEKDDESYVNFKRRLSPNGLIIRAALNYFVLPSLYKKVSDSILGPSVKSNAMVLMDEASASGDPHQLWINPSEVRKIPKPSVGFGYSSSFVEAGSANNLSLVWNKSPAPQWPLLLIFFLGLWVSFSQNLSDPGVSLPLFALLGLSGWFQWNRLVEKTSELMGRLVALGLLISIFPILIILSILTQIGSSGPVFFVQERVGRHGKPIYVWKFRTLTNEPDRRMRKVTWFGRWARACALDELPQLINIITGDMVWFGPRPTVKELLTEEYRPVYLAVSPGIYSTSAYKRGFGQTMAVTSVDIQHDVADQDLGLWERTTLIMKINFKVLLALGSKIRGVIVKANPFKDQERSHANRIDKILSEPEFFGLDNLNIQARSISELSEPQLESFSHRLRSLIDQGIDQLTWVQKMLMAREVGVLVKKEMGGSVGPLIGDKNIQFPLYNVNLESSAMVRELVRHMKTPDQRLVVFVNSLADKMALLYQVAESPQLEIVVAADRGLRLFEGNQMKVDVLKQLQPADVLTKRSNWIGVRQPGTIFQYHPQLEQIFSSIGIDWIDISAKRRVVVSLRSLSTLLKVSRLIYEAA